MNEPGEPNTGNPSVRFDEGRVGDGHWRHTPLNPSSPPTLPSQTDVFKSFTMNYLQMLKTRFFITLAFSLLSRHSVATADQPLV